MQFASSLHFKEKAGISLFSGSNLCRFYFIWARFQNVFIKDFLQYCKGFTVVSCPAWVQSLANWISATHGTSQLLSKELFPFSQTLQMLPLRFLACSLSSLTCPSSGAGCSSCSARPYILILLVIVHNPLCTPGTTSTHPQETSRCVCPGKASL